MLKNHKINLIVWLVLIMVLMGIPGNYFPRVNDISDLFTWDKLIHFFLFSVLFVLIFNYLINVQRVQKKINSLMIAFIIGMIYGAITEVLQYYIFIGRNGNIIDFIADCIGLFLGFLIIFVLKNKENN